MIGSARQSFCEPGDSGAFIIDVKGKWCGVLFAYPSVSISGDGYAMSAEELVEDVEKLTGGQVSLP